MTMTRVTVTSLGCIFGDVVVVTLEDITALRIYQQAEEKFEK
jgi:hypothetical protein